MTLYRKCTFKMSNYNAIREKRDSSIKAPLNQKAQKARTFSLLDDFESGNVKLDDIIQIPQDTPFDAKKQRLSDNTSGFNFDQYLMNFALQSSMETEFTSAESNGGYSRKPKLDFNGVKKTTVNCYDEKSIMKMLDIPEEKQQLIKVDDNDEEINNLDIQVRSNKFDNYADSKDHTEIDFGDVFADIINSSSTNDDSQLEGDDIFDKPNERNELDDLEFSFENENVPTSMSMSTHELRKQRQGHHEQRHVSNSESKKEQELRKRKGRSTIKHHRQPAYKKGELEEEVLRAPKKITSDISFDTDEEPLFDIGAQAHLNELEPPEIYADDSYYRLERQISSKRSPGRVCTPVHRTFRKPSRPSIKVRDNLLNLIVESSDGNLDDATKYATEINSQNSSGIPLPEKTTELVTIPTTGPAIGGIKKAAIVRALLAKASLEAQKDHHSNTTPMKAPLKESISFHGHHVKHVGFYTATEKLNFVRENVVKFSTPVKSSPEPKLQSIEVDKENRSPLISKLRSKIKSPHRSLLHNSHNSAIRSPMAGRKKSQNVKWASVLEW